MADKLSPAQALYLEAPKGSDGVACGNCTHWIATGRCELMGKDDEVSADQVCYLYAPGEPMEEGEPRGLVTPEEVGLGQGNTSCGTCQYGGGTNCAHPLLSGLPINNELGCCNLWAAKETEMKKDDDKELRKALEGLQAAFAERDRLLKQLVAKMSNNLDVIERRMRQGRRADGDYQPGFNDDRTYTPGAGEGATPATTRQQADRYYRPEKFPDSGDGKEMFNTSRMDRERMRRTTGGRLDGRPIESRKTKKQARIL